MKQLVSLRVPHKLLVAIEALEGNPLASRSHTLIETLKRGYLFQRNDCRKVLMGINTRGTIKQQVAQSYQKGFWIGMGISSFTSIIIYIIGRVLW